MILVIAAMTASAQAQNQLFDFGWQFTHNGKTQNVDLPHDWDIFEGPNSGKGATGTGGGWFEAGKGEYRKTFKTPIGEVVKFHFEGVYQKAEVYVNGQRAGQHHYGYTPFTVDVTKYLNKDKKQANEVVVKVDNSEQPNCRWYSGSGIYRHVWLETMPAMHIAENGVFVTTPEVSSDKARVQVDVTVQNESQTDRNATVVVGSAQLMVFSFDAENGFVLNGKKVLINGACVHHDNGVLGARAFDDAEIRKVRQMKEAGFNLIRTSHNPTTRAFLDACDSLGMLVIDEAFDGWRTQKNPYDYSTVIDSCYREDIHAMVLRDSRPFTNMTRPVLLPRLSVPGTATGKYTTHMQRYLTWQATTT